MFAFRFPRLFHCLDQHTPVTDATLLDTLGYIGRSHIHRHNFILSSFLNDTYPSDFILETHEWCLLLYLRNSTRFEYSILTFQFVSSLQNPELATVWSMPTSMQVSEFRHFWAGLQISNHRKVQFKRGLWFLNGLEAVQTSSTKLVSLDDREFAMKRRSISASNWRK